jgi:hypothetical protein
MVMTIVHEYEADPEHYPSPDPKQMAKLDEGNMNSDLDVVLDMLCNSSSGFTLKVEAKE